MTSIYGNLIDSMRSFQFDPDKVKIGRASNDGVFTDPTKTSDAAEAITDDSVAAAERQSAEVRQASAQTLVQTQIIANQNVQAESDVGGDAAVGEFLDFMSKSTEEKMRALLLKGMGVTEEELASLPPEERAKIEEKIREKIEDAMENGGLAKV